MPILDGKVVRAVYRSLKLSELSSVDRPAQAGAKAVIMKRASELVVERAERAAEIAKYVCEADGAHSFAEVLTENKFSERIWPYADALSQSIRSIVGDTSLTTADREGRVSASVAEFLSAVRSISPETEKQLVELISKRDCQMPKTVEQLEAEVTTLKAANADLTTKLSVAEKAEADAKAKAKEMEEEWGKTKKALVDATDETISVGGQELRKSVVGEGNFTVAKALRDERDAAQFEKRADAEFRHLPGTTAEKAAVLKYVEAMPEDAKKAATAIFTASEKMIAAGFARIGTSHSAVTPTAKAAQATFDAKVSEIAKRDDCSRTDAMSKARREFPTEFAAAYGDGAPAAN